MQPNFQYSHINPEYNKNIQACVDWRFLVDIPNSGRILILYNQSIDFLFPIAQVYLPEMIISVIPSSGDYPLCTQLRFESTLTTIQGDVAHLPIRENTFDLVIDLNASIEKDALPAIIQCIKPGGSLVFGFPNPVHFRRNKKKYLQPGSFWKSILLIWKLWSIQSITKKVFGVLSDPIVPEIIFPINTQSIKFVMRRIFNRKFPPVFLCVSSLIASFPLTALLMPAYILILRKIK